ALLPFLISCLIWLDLVASLPLIKERILVIILLLHFLSLMLGSVLVLMLPLDRKSGSAGMPRPISYAVFSLKKKKKLHLHILSLSSRSSPLLFFFSTILSSPRSPLFPYTTLFRSALLPFLISCLIWLDLVASLPLIKERILVIILLLHFLSLMLGSVLVLMLPLLVWLTPDLRIKKSLLKCNWTIRKRLPRCK